MAVRAIWKGAVLAEAEHTVRLEGNDYFPPDALHREYFRNSTMSSVCPWKGTARYYTIVVGDAENPDAAWYYPNPSAAAGQIRDHVAFWHGVRIEGRPSPDGPDGAAGERRGWWRRLLGRTG